MDIRFDDKVAIVTGAGGGLGKSHALELARRGAKVVVNDLGAAVDGSGGSSAAAEQTVAEIAEAGGQAIANGASVADRQGVHHLIDQAMEAFGRIDIVVNNAGILRDKSFANMTLDDFDAVIDVHLRGAAYVSHAVWPIMKDQGFGRIVMTSSSTGLFGNFGQANYGAAKLAQVGLMNTLKIEGAKYGIHVNSLVPIAVTRMTRDLFPEAILKLFEPALVTPAVIYLASAQAPNGVILGAGGGHFAVSEMVETPGMYLGTDASAEDIAAAWDKISGRAGSTPFPAGAGHTEKYAKSAFAGGTAGE